MPGSWRCVTLGAKSWRTSDNWKSISRTYPTHRRLSFHFLQELRRMAAWPAQKEVKIGTKTVQADATKADLAPGKRNLDPSLGRLLAPGRDQNLEGAGWHRLRPRLQPLKGPTCQSKSNVPELRRTKNVAKKVLNSPCLTFADTFTSTSRWSTCRQLFHITGQGFF
eukprot:g15650.t1